MILRRDRVNKVEVYMLGRFSIMCGDEDILDVLGNSKKKIQLLQYLLVNKDTKYTNYNLFEHLWPSDDTSNPESALKTLVSRLRQDLRAFGLSSLISTIKGVYQLNEELCENIDLYEFEQLAADATRDSIRWTKRPRRYSSAYCFSIRVICFRAMTQRHG